MIDTKGTKFGNPWKNPIFYNDVALSIKVKIEHSDLSKASNFTFLSLYNSFNFYTILGNMVSKFKLLFRLLNIAFHLSNDYCFIFCQNHALRFSCLFETCGICFITEVKSS